MPTVLITGANRGIGLELVRLFVADGWSVHAVCRQPDKAKSLKEIEGRVSVHRADVTDGLRVASLARELSDEPIDILINNAGQLGGRAGFGETDYDLWLETLKVNTLAPLRLVERFADHVEASERKLIVNISSLMGSIARTESGGNYIYRSSKAALNKLTCTLAVDLKPRGIAVVSVHPGWVSTDMGGPEAPLAPPDSAKALHALFLRLKPTDSGRFFNYDGGELPW